MQRNEEEERILDTVSALKHAVHELEKETDCTRIAFESKLAYASDLLKDLKAIFGNYQKEIHKEIIAAGMTSLLRQGYNFEKVMIGQYTFGVNDMGEVEDRNVPGIPF